jgi:hypothetical protein
MVRDDLWPGNIFGVIGFHLRTYDETEILRTACQPRRMYSKNTHGTGNNGTVLVVLHLTL